jgi:hypothetical protein
VKAAAAPNTAAPVAGRAPQRRFGDSASSAIAAASWPSLAAQESVEQPSDAYVQSQDRV